MVLGKGFTAKTPSLPSFGKDIYFASLGALSALAVKN